MLEYFTKLFELLAKKLHLKESTSNEIFFWLLLAVVVTVILFQIWKLIKRIVLWRNQKLLNRDLFPYYSKVDVINATKYYIDTYYQNVDPSEDDEPSRRFIASAKSKLIPIFLKKVFKFNSSENKYYIILADTGMGKTTVLINLFIKYKNMFKSPFSPSKYSIKLLPLSYPYVLDEIKKVKDKSNSILLLDALDEDFKAVHDYKRRLNQISHVAYNFRAIVITCRTQFFPTQWEEPYTGGYLSTRQNEDIKFQKVYLSVFDEKDVKKYLRKQFSIVFQYNQYIRAKKIIAKSPNLVVRPMLLSYIKELMVSNKNYEFTFQVYEELIWKWIKREGLKPGIRENYGNSESFEKSLFTYSQQLALNLYEHRKANYGLVIGDPEDDIPTSYVKYSNIDLSHYLLSSPDGKTKSLLNRTSDGDYKFSHKSIQEYFLATVILMNAEFYLKFDFKIMNATWLFLKEMLIHKLRHNFRGEIKYLRDPFGNDKQKLETIHDLTLKNIDLVRVIKIDKLPFDLLLFKEFSKLKILSMTEYVIELANLKLQIQKEISTYILSHQGVPERLPKDALYKDFKENPVFHLLYKAIEEKSGLIDHTSPTLDYLKWNSLVHIHDFFLYTERLEVSIEFKIENANDYKADFCKEDKLKLEKIERFLIKKAQLEKLLPHCEVRVLQN